MKLRLVLFVTAALFLANPSFGQVQSSLYDYNTKAAWDAFYEVGVEGAWGRTGERPEINLNYHSYALRPREQIRAQNLFDALGYDDDTRLLVFRCGFGWILEAFRDLGLDTVVGWDDSAYIQSAKKSNEDGDTNAAITAVGLVTFTGDGLTLFNTFRGDGGPRSNRPGRIRQEDVTKTSGRVSLRNKVGGPGMEILVYDGFIQAMTDAEAIVFSDFLHLMNPTRVVHEVFDEFLNFKTLADWKALLPDDTFVDAGTLDVL